MESPEGRTGEITSILARIKGGLEVEHFETLCARKDGTVFPVLLTVSPIRDANGAVVGASTITRDMTKEKEAFTAARDVTEHKRALAEIAHQAKELERLADLERARSMMESSLDALVAISSEEMITDANDATVKATGIPGWTPGRGPSGSSGRGVSLFAGSPRGVPTMQAGTH